MSVKIFKNEFIGGQYDKNTLINALRCYVEAHTSIADSRSYE